MRVLGLDPSKSCTGWACFDGTVWQSGSLRCPVKRPPDADTLSAAYTGEVLQWIAGQVYSLLIEHEPVAVAIEQPLVTTSGSGKKGAMPMQTVHLLNAFAGEIARVCHRLNVPAVYVHAATWRRGFGVKAKDSKRAKAEALEICRIEGIPVHSADEAEAVGIARWLYGARTQTRFSRISDTPLFAEEAA